MELSDLLVLLGMGRQDLRFMFQHIDLDNDGRISFDEFLKFLCADIVTPNC